MSAFDAVTEMKTAVAGDLVAAGATALWMAAGSFPFHFAAAGAGGHEVAMNAACYAQSRHKITGSGKEFCTVAVGDHDRTCNLRFEDEAILCRHPVGVGASYFREEATLAESS